MDISIRSYLDNLAGYLQNGDFSDSQLQAEKPGAILFLYEYGKRTTQDACIDKADALVTELENNFTTWLQLKNPLAIQAAITFVYLVSRHYLDSDDETLTEYDQYLDKQFVYAHEQELLLKYYSLRLFSVTSVFPLSRPWVDNLIRLERNLRHISQNLHNLQYPVNTLFWLQQLSHSSVHPFLTGMSWETCISQLLGHIQTSVPSLSFVERKKWEYLVSPCLSFQNPEQLLPDFSDPCSIGTGLLLLAFSQPEEKELLYGIY